MTWTQARLHHRTLASVTRELDLDPTGPVPWRPEYAAVFDTPERLRLALLTQWATIVRAQSQDLPFDEIVGAHPGLAAVAGRRPGLLDHAMAAAS